MRINFSDEEDYAGQFDLWQANCRRSLMGRSGQEELKSLRDALLNLPEKRLICGLLYNDGEVCAVGAYARNKGLDLEKFDPEEESDEVGIKAGMPRLVAWKVVEMNDYEFDHLSPEQRYERMLSWVNNMLQRKP